MHAVMGDDDSRPVEWDGQVVGEPGARGLVL